MFGAIRKDKSFHISADRYGTHSAEDVVAKMFADERPAHAALYGLCSP